jgi:hypothetical protein
MKGRRSLQEQTTEQTKKIFSKVRFNLDDYRDMSSDMYHHFEEKFEAGFGKSDSERPKPTYEDLNNMMWDVLQLNHSLEATIDGVELVVKLLSNLIASTLQKKLDDEHLYLDIPKEIQRELKLWFKRQEEMKRAMRDFDR